MPRPRLPCLYLARHDEGVEESVRRPVRLLHTKPPYHRAVYPGRAVVRAAPTVQVLPRLRDPKVERVSLELVGHVPVVQMGVVPFEERAQAEPFPWRPWFRAQQLLVQLRKQTVTKRVPPLDA